MNSAKSEIQVIAPEWVKDAAAWQAFTDEFFGKASNVADLYGCISVLIKKMMFEGLKEGLTLDTVDAWAIYQLMELQRGLGQSMGVVDECGAVVVRKRFNL